jgi:NAD-dependent deacetylase
MDATAAIRRAVELIHHGARIVAFTGAGFSTASGIPDFRSAEGGLWSKIDPMEVASLSAFRFTPERFYDWARPLAARLSAAEPNPAHFALHALERTGREVTVITQNIDNLHQKAGSSRVIEIHGSFRTLICTGCRRRFDTETEIEPRLLEMRIPLCPHCRSILKPGATLFGEDLPRDSWQAAAAACRECDVMIVAGTALEVYPAAELPEIAVRNRAAVISVNISPTPLEPRASVAVRGRVEHVLPTIAAEVKALG